MGYFSWLDGRPVLHELIIGVFVMITTPVTISQLAALKALIWALKSSVRFW